MQPIELLRYFSRGEFLDNISLALYELPTIEKSTCEHSRINQCFVGDWCCSMRLPKQSKNDTIFDNTKQDYKSEHLLMLAGAECSP